MNRSTICIAGSGDGQMQDSESALSRLRAMVVGAIAVAVGMAAKEFLDGDRFGPGHVVGWLIGGAFVGLGVRWLINRRGKAPR